MYEQILQKLIAQRGTKSVISDRSLQDWAKNLETLITTPEMLEKYDVAPVLASLEGNINHYTAEAVKAAVKKSVEDAKKGQTTPTTPPVTEPPSQDMPEWAKVLLKQNEALNQSILAMQGDKIVANRTEQVKKLMVDAPKWYTDTVLSSFGKMKFETEEEFTEYAGTLKTQIEAANQSAKESGITFNVPKQAKQEPPTDELHPLFKQALDQTKVPAK